MRLISLSIPYLYLLHVLVISIRIGATLLFAPIWGDSSLPQYLRLLLVFSIAAGISVVVPFNAQALANPGLVFPAELLVGLLLTMGKNQSWIRERLRIQDWFFRPNCWLVYS